MRSGAIMVARAESQVQSMLSGDAAVKLQAVRCSHSKANALLLASKTRISNCMDCKPTHTRIMDCRCVA